MNGYFSCFSPKLFLEYLAHSTKKVRLFQARLQVERHLSGLLSLAIYFNKMALREDG